MIRALSTIAAMAVLGTGAQADPATARLKAAIRLDGPLQGASLHEGDIDMVVYYLPRGAALGVVATYADRDRPDRPGRIQFDLADGEEITLGFNTREGLRYRFVRTDCIVAVSASIHSDQSSSAAGDG